jgi:hypothetical protein
LGAVGTGIAQPCAERIFALQGMLDTRRLCSRQRGPLAWVDSQRSRIGATSSPTTIHAKELATMRDYDAFKDNVLAALERVAGDAAIAENVVKATVQLA